jgi:copper chaperone NosL
MTIVDNKFGAEIVTSKGKIFKFDAVECLVNFSKESPQQEGDNYYVINYQNGEWIVAERAFYLRSKRKPSPMGQYITAFNTREAAMDIQKENEGVIQSWNELIDNFEISNIGNF